MPLIELGNIAPIDAKGDPIPGPRVTTLTITPGDEEKPNGYSIVGIGDDSYPDELEAALKGVKNRATRRMIIDGWLAHPDGVHGLPNHEALAAVIDPGGHWAKHSTADPEWVWSDNEKFAAQLADYFGCPVGAPKDVEGTHHTRAGGPGVYPDPLGGLVMLKTAAGNDQQSQQMGGGLVGETGTATATTATSITTNSARSAALNDLAGQTVIAHGGGAYGLIVSNTAGTNTVLTIDRWSTPATPGGAAAATPAATTGYTVMPGGLPSWFGALTANAVAPASGDTTLAGEITTAGGGLVAKIGTYGHTAGVNSHTETFVWTANASDVLPVTVAKGGFGQSIVSTVRKQFQTLLNATATLSASGDQVTVTQTVTT